MGHDACGYRSASELFRDSSRGAARASRSFEVLQAFAIEPPAHWNARPFGGRADGRATTQAVHGWPRCPSARQSTLACASATRSTEATGHFRSAAQLLAEDEPRYHMTKKQPRQGMPLRIAVARYFAAMRLPRRLWWRSNGANIL